MLPGAGLAVCSLLPAVVPPEPPLLPVAGPAPHQQPLLPLLVLHQARVVSNQPHRELQTPAVRLGFKLGQEENLS